jgi:heat shock protein HslJ
MKASVSSSLAAAGLMLALTGCGLAGGVSLPEAPGTASAASASAVPGGTWRLVSLREAGQPEVAIARPDLFTAEFTAEGRLHLRADCNRCAGSYTAGDRTVSMSPMACTRAYCGGTAPLDDTFTRLAGAAATWSAGNDTLELASEAGILRFRR